MVLRHWPRRSPGLPPGQRLSAGFPRFSDQPLRPPPPAGDVELRVRAPGLDDLVIDSGGLDGLPDREQRSDFHCVTTWSHVGVTWGGVPMRTIWEALVEPWAGSAAEARFAVAVAADHHRAVLLREDLLGDDVLVARTLDGQPLDARHGSPLRLVSPSQYGYKSVKHLVAIELHQNQPVSRLGAKEHLRARVALEERHSRVSGRLLRWPYRLVVPLTAALSERSARRVTVAS